MSATGLTAISIGVRFFGLCFLFGQRFADEVAARRVHPLVFTRYSAKNEPTCVGNM
jgi:hypothetical protein